MLIRSRKLATTGTSRQTRRSSNCSGSTAANQHCAPASNCDTHIVGKITDRRYGVTSSDYGNGSANYVHHCLWGEPIRVMAMFHQLRCRATLLREKLSYRFRDVASN